jgi:hypothetical protein
VSSTHEDVTAPITTTTAPTHLLRHRLSDSTSYKDVHLSHRWELPPFPVLPTTHLLWYRLGEVHQWQEGVKHLRSMQCRVQGRLCWKHSFSMHWITELAE